MVGFIRNPRGSSPERGALAFAMADSAAASPAPSPAKVKERSRDQLLKLLESSARKLKQFDKKYGESKKKVADLVARSQKLEEENAKLQAALDGGGAAAAEAQRSVEEKDDAIRVLSNELTGLQHEHGEKLRAKVEEVLAAEGERDEERRRVDELLVKVSDLEGQLVAAKPTEGDGERTELVERCRALEDRCGKLSESEKQATDELKQRLQKMQEEEKRLNYLESQVRELQAECEVASGRAQEAEALEADLQAKVEEAVGESDRLSRRLSESEARLSEALLAAASSEASAEVVEGDAEEKDAVIRGLREELERAKAESIELRAEIEGAAAGGVDAEAEAALREEVRSLQAERDRLSGELQSSKDLLRESSETNERAKSNVEDLKKKFLATAKKKQLEFKSKIDQLQRRLAEQQESARAALAEAGEGSKNGQVEAEALRTEKEALEARTKELEALAETQRGVIADLEGRAKAAEEGQGQRQEGQAKKLKAAVLELKRKLDKSEKARQRDAKELARAQASLDGEREKMRQAEEASGHQTSRLESELKTYKARAHMLLQQKEDQLKNTVSTEMADQYRDRISSLETEVEELVGGRKGLEQAYAELRERHGRELADLAEVHRAELATKEGEALEREREASRAEEGARADAEEARAALAKADGAAAELREACRSLEGERDEAKADLSALRDQHEALEKEYKLYRETQEDLVQEKERELSELSASLRDSQTLAAYKDTAGPSGSQAAAAAAPKPPAASPEAPKPAGLPLSEPSSGFSLEDDLLKDITSSNIIEAAKLQASRDAFLGEYISRIAELEGEALEYQKEIEMREQLESVLKEELRKKEREETRSNLKESGSEMEYMKNIILKLLETGDHEVLLPVVSKLLALSPEETQRVKKAYVDGTNRQASDPLDLATKAATDVTSYLSGWVFSSKK